ncbi:uncharacterized protein TRUGW13939_04806 [Talaromyces rugulosus]|uniref:Uncharacterized protein n=1 Tax=Talaromyces rugulosus TaxID=121627 RepID=A0A7H8QVC9_TALRU|nr:uncharacterized protein TRUGW13939_04806 [Talaromyces rugulosus]QKX57688.1 hypothetical protein TRUGW13939_04806 [Talaromyces rugulosus]
MQYNQSALLLDENRILLEQNNEKICRQSSRSTVVGNAKVMSYDDIIKAQRKHDLKPVKPGSIHQKSSKTVDRLLSKSEKKMQSRIHKIYKAI